MVFKTHRYIGHIAFVIQEESLFTFTNAQKRFLLNDKGYVF